MNKESRKLDCRPLLFGVMILVANPALAETFMLTQDKTQQAEKVPDWVSSMPVSMNGVVPYSQPIERPLWQKDWEKEHWHDLFIARMNNFSEWDPKTFFDDQGMIDFCNAISKVDLVEMQRLVDHGVDINTVGRDGMTLLYWALFLDTDPRPFGMLLELGANPNVIVQHKGRPGERHTSIESGFAVVHLVTRGAYNRHFKNVYEHGGDPNLIDKNPFFSRPAFHELWSVAPDAVERLELMMEKGANLDLRSKKGLTFLSNQLGRDELGCRLGLIALQAGADYAYYYPPESLRASYRRYKFGYFRLIHFLAEAAPYVEKRPKNKRTYFNAVVAWLEERGQSLAEAKADLERWGAWNKNGQTELIEEEHLKRLAEEAKKPTDE